MYSQSALVHEDKQCSTAHLGGRAVFRAGTAWKWQWCHEKQIGFGLRTLWASFFFSFFPGRGVKSRLQCWGCMCPAPRAMTKNMGHSFTHTHSVTRRHTHALLFSLHLCLFSPSLYLQLSSQERNSLFLEVNAHAGVLFDTTQEGNRQSPFVEIWIS